jgi:hypothetical protein
VLIGEQRHLTVGLAGREPAAIRSIRTKTLIQARQLLVMQYTGQEQRERLAHRVDARDQVTQHVRRQSHSPKGNYERQSKEQPQSISLIQSGVESATTGSRSEKGRTSGWRSSTFVLYGKSKNKLRPEHPDHSDHLEHPEPKQVGIVIDMLVTLYS